MTPTKTFAKALIVRGEKVLLLRRAINDSWRPGRLDLAGGAIEDSEDIIQGLLREIKEETGLTLLHSDVKLAFANSSAEEEQNKNRLYFLAYDQSDIGVVLSPEHSEANWMDLDQAISQNDHPIQNEFLRYIKTHHLLALPSGVTLQ